MNCEKGLWGRPLSAGLWTGRGVPTGAVGGPAVGTRFVEVLQHLFGFVPASDPSQLALARAGFHFEGFSNIPGKLLKFNTSGRRI